MNQHELTLLVGALGGNLATGTSRFHKTTCLLAPWRHDGGKDSKPSAGVSSDSPHIYTCFSCGASYRLFELVYEIHRLNQRAPAPYEINFTKALDMALQEEDKDSSSLAFDPSQFQDYEASQSKGPQPWPEDHLKNFIPATHHWYVQKRGIPPELAEKYEIVFDPYYNRICFPIRDYAGRLMGIHGRALDDTNDLRYFSYGYMNQRNPEIMIGEQFADGSKPVIVTEGMFDLTNLAQVYPNVVATKSCSIQKTMMTRLAEFPAIITAFDTGVGGDKGRQAIEWVYDSRKPVIHMIPEVKYGDYGATPLPSIQSQLGRGFQALS